MAVIIIKDIAGLEFKTRFFLFIGIKVWIKVCLSEALIDIVGLSTVSEDFII
jgi:hypothetical protein